MLIGIISHFTTRKTGAPREMADWHETRILSHVTDQGAYNVKPVGIARNLVTLELCWTPEAPQEPTPDAQHC